jgi:hypothetical protein
MSTARDVWELHLAGVPVDQIADTTHTTVVEVADIVSRFAPTARAGEGPEVELARLNNLWRKVYPTAMKGDLKAYAIVLRLSARRLDLQQQVTRTIGDDPATRLAGDDERGALVALRDMIAATLERTKSARDIAALSGRLQDVLERIADLDARHGTGTAPVDEIAARYRQRRSRPIRDGIKRDA